MSDAHARKIQMHLGLHLEREHQLQLHNLAKRAQGVPHPQFRFRIYGAEFAKYFRCHFYACV